MKLLCEKGGNYTLYEEANSRVKWVIDLCGNQHPSVANNAYLRGWETKGCDRSRNGGEMGAIKRKRRNSARNKAVRFRETHVEDMGKSMSRLMYSARLRASEIPFTVLR